MVRGELKTLSSEGFTIEPRFVGENDSVLHLILYDEIF
jgi:hypothetical protein